MRFLISAIASSFELNTAFRVTAAAPPGLGAPPTPSVATTLAAGVSRLAERLRLPPPPVMDPITRSVPQSSARSREGGLSSSGSDLMTMLARVEDVAAASEAGGDFASGDRTYLRTRFAFFRRGLSVVFVIITINYYYD